MGETVARHLRSLRRWAGTFRGAALLLTALTCALTWGLWKSDLTHDDTASYFVEAANWKTHGTFSSPLAMAFSPLYAAFYGWVQRVFADAGDASAVHRFLIVLAAGLGTLAALRQMLPRAWAWLAAAWWVGINWRVLFEVHLFGYALIITAAACAGAGRSPWWRGGALALLGASACLVRNEYVPAVALFAICCGVHAWRHAPRAWLPLAAPGVLLALWAAWLFSGNPVQLNPAALRAAFETRQRANLAQVYPFSYQQRHRDWTGDPWREGAQLVQRDFGKPDPKMGEAFLLAPRAMAEHVLWHLRLLPAGLQQGFFGCYTGSIPPDFSPRRDPALLDPLLPSLAVLAALGAGVFLLMRRRRAGRPLFLRGAPGRWSWILLACCVPSCFAAIATQRPRASYIFPLSLLLLALTVLSVRAVLKALQVRQHLPAASLRWLPVAGAFGLSALLLLRAAALAPVPRPLLEDYRRVNTLSVELSQPDRTFCANTPDADDLLRYLADGRRSHWAWKPWAKVQAAVHSGQTLTAALAESGITDLYLRGTTAPDLADGWQRLAAIENGPASWQYWALRPPGAPSR